MKKIVFSLLIIFCAYCQPLFSQKFPLELNGFKIGDTGQEICGRANEILAFTDAGFCTNDWIQFHCGEFPELPADEWNIGFYENKCFRIELKLNQNGDNFEAYDNAIKYLKKKYKKPAKINDNGFMKQSMWFIKDKKNKMNYTITAQIDIVPGENFKIFPRIIIQNETVNNEIISNYQKMSDDLNKKK